VFKIGYAKDFVIPTDPVLLKKLVRQHEKEIKRLYNLVVKYEGQLQDVTEDYKILETDNKWYKFEIQKLNRKGIKLNKQIKELKLEIKKHPAFIDLPNPCSERRIRLRRNNTFQI
jgi:chromosome segregation ATPase